MPTHIDSSSVTYEPPRFDPVSGQREQRAEYRTIDAGALVVWVNPPNQDSVHSGGHFELYDGAPADYVAVTSR